MEHRPLYDLEDKIRAEVANLSDDDIAHAYWRDYEGERGLFEHAIRDEYWRRRIDHKRHRKQAP